MSNLSKNASKLPNNENINIKKHEKFFVKVIEGGVPGKVKKMTTKYNSKIVS